MTKNLNFDSARFFPSKIYDDETTKIVVTGNPEKSPIKVYDNGTHGDDIANDGLYSRACVSKDDLGIIFSENELGGKASSYKFNDGYLRVVNSDLRETVSVVNLTKNLSTSGHAMFMELDQESYEKVRTGNGYNLQDSRTCEVCVEVLSFFGDVFDHLILVPDEPDNISSYHRTSDNIKGIMTYGDPICDPITWNNHGKNNNVNQDYKEAKFGCPSKFLDGRDYPRLKGIIWAGDPYIGRLNSEFGHWIGVGPKNGNFPPNSEVSWNSNNRMDIDNQTTVKGPWPITGPLLDPERQYSPHYVNVLSDNQWSLSRIKSEGNGLFSLAPQKSEDYKFDNILLYMMGFVSYEDALVDKYYYLNGLDLEGCTTGEETLMCTAQDTVIHQHNTKKP